MSRSGVRNHHVLVVPIVVDDAAHALPRVLDVVEVPPEVAGLNDGAVVRLHARVDLVDRPAARVHHGLAGAVEVVPELWIAPVHVGREGVATVQLDVVYVPRREGLRVGLEVAQDAGVAGARVVPEVLVDPELQSFGMDLQED